MLLADAASLAASLMHYHGLQGWRFRFDRARRRFGACHFAEHSISLSRDLTRLNDEPVVRDVILHEIAHALAGPHAGHGPVWKRIAAGLGVRPTRGVSAPHIVMPAPPFAGVCPTCGIVVRRHRRDPTACKRCCDRYNGGRFSRRFLLDWSDHAPSLAEELAG